MSCLTGSLCPKLYSMRCAVRRRACTKPAACSLSTRVQCNADMHRLFAHCLSQLPTACSWELRLRRVEAPATEPSSRPACVLAEALCAAITELRCSGEA